MKYTAQIVKDILYNAGYYENEEGSWVFNNCGYTAVFAEVSLNDLVNRASEASAEGRGDEGVLEALEDQLQGCMVYSRG